MGTGVAAGDADGQLPASRRRRLACVGLLVAAGVVVAIVLESRLPAPPARLATGSDARRHTASKRARMVSRAALRHLLFRSDGHLGSGSAAPTLRGKRGPGGAPATPRLAEVRVDARLAPASDERRAAVASRPMPNLCLCTGRAAGDGAADRGLRKHADSEQATEPRVAFGSSAVSLAKVAASGCHTG